MPEFTFYLKADPDLHDVESTIIAVRAGVPGYFPIFSRASVDDLNEGALPPDVAESALAASMFGWDCPAAQAAKDWAETGPMDIEWVEQEARDLWATDEIEIDDKLTSKDFSRGDGGTWVHAWVWVPDAPREQGLYAEQSPDDPNVWIVYDADDAIVTTCETEEDALAYIDNCG